MMKNKKIKNNYKKKRLQHKNLFKNVWIIIKEADKIKAKSRNKIFKHLSMQ